MAATATKITGGLKNLDTEIHHVAFTSTTATVEVTTNLSVIYAMTAQRVGGDSANGGYLTLDETDAATGIAVTAGAITLDRTLVQSGGTLGTESFLVTLHGKS